MLHSGVTFNLAVNHSFHLRETPVTLLIAFICPSPPLLNENQGIRTGKKKGENYPAEKR